MSTPPPTHHDALLQGTLQSVTTVISVASFVVAGWVGLLSDTPLVGVAALLVFVLTLITQILLRRGRVALSLHLMIATVLVAAGLASFTFGSVRSAAVMLFMGAVVGAGIFTSGRTMLITTLTAVSMIAVLIWVEREGLIAPRQGAIGLSALVTYSASIVVVAMMLVYSRRRNELTLERLQNELDARRRTEQERDRSLQRFVRIFHNSPTPMLAQSARDGLILDVNPAFERCYGLAREDVLGKIDSQFWSDPHRRSEYMGLLRRQRRTDQLPVRSVRANGSQFDALVSSELSEDPRDQLVITTIVDVSAQTEALDRLRRSEERFAKAFNFSPMNLSITRLSDGMIMEVNRGDTTSQDLQEEPLRGRTTLQTGAWVTPAEREAFVERLRRDGRVNGYESRMLDKDGTLVDVRLWAVIIDLDGEECILSSTVNVSEEKRREALLLSVARGMTGETGKAFFSALTRHAAQTLKADIVLIGELRADQRIHTLSVWVDGQPAPDFDYDPNGMPCQGTLAQHDLFVQESGLMASFPDAQLLSTLQAEAYVGQCLFDQDGTPAGVLAALWRQPISVGAEARALMSIFASRAAAELIRMHREREIQRLNATLEQRVKLRTAELEKLNAELDSFAYSVSHDLKSPLRSIDGFTQLLSEQLQGRLSQDEEQLLDRVLKSTRRMSTLIADMLALARVSQGQMELALTDLSDIAEQVMQAERVKHPERTLEWRIEQGLMAVCDPRLVRIALENLLGNAVKYTRDQPQALIEMGRRDRSGPFPGMFFVRDNGVGFNMAYADKLFKPFQRLHGPSEFEGTGIGLATVRRIVERHGGHIDGSAKPGAGAEFRFSLGPTPLPR